MMLAVMQEQLYSFAVSTNSAHRKTTMDEHIARVQWCRNKYRRTAHYYIKFSVMASDIKISNMEFQ